MTVPLHFHPQQGHRNWSSFIRTVFTYLFVLRWKLFDNLLSGYTKCWSICLKLVACCLFNVNLSHMQVSIDCLNSRQDIAYICDMKTDNMRPQVTSRDKNRYQQPLCHHKGSRTPYFTCHTRSWPRSGRHTGVTVFLMLSSLGQYIMCHQSAVPTLHCTASNNNICVLGTIVWVSKL